MGHLPSHTAFSSLSSVYAAVQGKEETRFQEIRLSLRSEIFLPRAKEKKKQPKKDQVSCTAPLLPSVYRKIFFLNAENNFFSDRNH